MSDSETPTASATRASQVILEVNGKSVPLNPFVTGMLGSTIKGMVEALKLEKAPHTISIHLTFARSD